MSNKSGKRKTVDPLKNLTELISFLVDFALTYSLLVIVVLGIGFLTIILFLINFFNLLGF